MEFAQKHDFAERSKAEAGNMLLSYSEQEDKQAHQDGYIYCGVAQDSAGAEVHVFVKAPLQV